MSLHYKTLVPILRDLIECRLLNNRGVNQGYKRPGKSFAAIFHGDVAGGGWWEDALVASRAQNLAREHLDMQKSPLLLVLLREKRGIIQLLLIPRRCQHDLGFSLASCTGTLS